ALDGADPGPRASPRKVGSDIAPLLQLRAKSSTAQQRPGARILLVGIARLPGRPRPREAAGGSPLISVQPCRDARRVRPGYPSLTVGLCQGALSQFLYPRRPDNIQ